MAKNSKNKGSRFERVVAKFWQDWTGYTFSRTPGSGGWAKAKDSFGDLVCTDSRHSRRFPFSIECKSYQDIRFEHLLLGNKSCKILSFWEQATYDAKRANKIPILIMKYNNMPKEEAFFLIELSIFKKLKIIFLKANSKVYPLIICLLFNKSMAMPIAPPVAENPTFPPCTFSSAATPIFI